MTSRVEAMQKSGTFIKRKVTYGGKSKAELLEILRSLHIKTNEYADILFSCAHFQTSEHPITSTVVEFAIRELGVHTPYLSDIIRRAKDLGMSPCPLEIAPYLRIQYLDQEEEIETERGKAPKGSLTFISEIFHDESDDFPKGFYIRKINGELWLRGFVCSQDHVWNQEDKVAFLLEKGDRDISFSL